jgi:hypothetical protein
MYRNSAWNSGADLTRMRERREVRFSLKAEKYMHAYTWWAWNMDITVEKGLKHV